MTKAKDAGIRRSGSSGLLHACRISSAAYWSVAVLLGAGVVFAAFLISKHFGGGLPGCGPTSGCEALEKSVWGTVPGIRWPVSFLGFAYFCALLVAWMTANRGVPVAARWLLRVGAAASLLFIVVMFAYRKVCPYCVGVHTANLGVLFVIERETWRAARRSLSGGESMSWVLLRKIAGFGLGAFLVVSLALGVANARMQKKEGATAESARRASTDQILAQAQSQTLAQAQIGQGTASAGSADMWGKAGFTGRYRRGPEASPIRMVLLTDYQCVDCQKVEAEVEEIMTSRTDVSLSIKHYPFCAEASPGVPCNKYVKTLHANACWAARAAEAAGILKGEKGFWDMHKWLFAKKGSFTDADLQSGLREMGQSPEAFLAVMKGDETLRRVQADCDEGSALGVYFTPMVFVNGVEFKGWQVAGALKRTVAEVAAKNPPALTATADRPALASTKDVQDWRDQPVRALAADTRSWSTGAASANTAPAGTRFVDVVLFGDYQEPFTAAMDIAIRDLMKTKPNVRYTWRHFPIDPKSNPTLPPNVRPEALHPLAGRMAQAAEAAGSLGGAKGYWKMHDWLVRNFKTFSDESLRAAAPKLGFKADAMLAEMGKPEAAAAITEDCRAAQQVGLNAVPMVFVNGKWIMRTLRDQENVVLRVIDAAGKP